MGVYSFDELRRHIGHRIVCVPYGRPPANVSVECEDCNEVLLDFDRADSSPMDMVYARKDQEEVHRVRDEILRRQSEDSEVEQFLHQASTLILAAGDKDINFRLVEQSRGYRTIENDDGSRQHVPNREWTLSIKVGFCLHDKIEENGMCKRCRTRQTG